MYIPFLNPSLVFFAVVGSYLHFQVINTRAPLLRVSVGFARGRHQQNYTLLRADLLHSVLVGATNAHAFANTQQGQRWCYI
jgi:hypothetical protein